MFMWTANKISLRDYTTTFSICYITINILKYMKNIMIILKTNRGTKKLLKANFIFNEFENSKI